MSIIIDEHQPQFKANLHSHSLLSDGKLSVDELINTYKANNYQVLAITDHETPLRHSNLSTEEFLVLDGYEAYIRPSDKCIFNRFKPEIHLNLIAKNSKYQDPRIPPDMLPYLGYNFFYTKYFDRKRARKVDIARTLKKRKFTVRYINTFIENAHKADYFVFLNHPYWSMMDAEDMLQLVGIDSVEVFNTASMIVNNDEGDVQFYDTLLRHRKTKHRYLRRDSINLSDTRKPYCHGADDNHNPGKKMEDSFGAFTYIIADHLDYPSVSRALECGDFYASTGPQFKSIEIVGSNAKVKTAESVKSIVMHITPKFSCRVTAESELRGDNLSVSPVSVDVSSDTVSPDGALSSDSSVGSDSNNSSVWGVSEAEFKIPGSCRYVYFSIRDKEGKLAVTRYYEVNRGSSDK